jgi:hypothetical protein
LPVPRGEVTPIGRTPIGQDLIGVPVEASNAVAHVRQGRDNVR